MCMMFYAKSYSTESEGLNKEIKPLLFLDFYVAGRPPS
jgi:hypothetical protein